MSLPLYKSTPSDRLLELTKEVDAEVPTYAEVGALWNTFKGSMERPTLEDFGQWLSGSGKYEGHACEVTW